MTGLTESYLGSLLAMSIIALGGWCAQWTLEQRRRVWAGVLFATVAVNVGCVLVHVRAAYVAGEAAILREIDAANAECPNTPKIVPYHEGMTLCPGQIVVVPLPMPAAPPIAEPDAAAPGEHSN